jgi:hypothetical protein
MQIAARRVRPTIKAPRELGVFMAELQDRNARYCSGRLQRRPRWHAPYPGASEVDRQDGSDCFL